MHERRYRAEIRPHQGVPTLHIDGQPDPAVGYLTFHPEARGRFGDFADAGIRLVALNTTCNFHTYGTARPVAVGPGRFDYSHLDRRVRMILTAHSDAILLPRVYIGSPPWWDVAHPEELVRYADGSCTRPFFSGALKGTVPSFSSAAWRSFARDSLARLIRHVEASDYGHRVIGYQLMGGETEEWFYHGTYEGFLSDYSDVHQAAFRAWQLARPGGLRGLLRRFGKRSHSPVPEASRRGGDGRSILVDPLVDGDVAEYILFRSQEVADTVLELAAVVKETTGGAALCGAFYGYVMELASHPFGLQHSGHLSFDRIVQSPDIDFLTSPTSYLDRGVGTGYSAFMCMTDSAKLHGKLWFNENDSRTHRTPPQYGCFRTTNPTETASIMRREFAHSMARGAGMWWFDMRGGWYRDPRNLAEVARLTRVGRRLIEHDRRSSAEVAVLVDGEAMRYFRLRNPIQRQLLGAQLQHLGRTGAPFDCIELSDLDVAGDYKVYLVLGPLELSRGDRRRLAALHRDGKMIIWIYAPGVIDGGRIDPGAMESVVGMKMEQLEGAVRAQVDVVPSADPCLARMDAPLHYGVADVVEPVFVPRDPACRRLGTVNGTDECGLAVKAMRGWTSVFSVGPSLPAELLRSLLAAAGVHMYTDGDVVYGNRSLLAVHTRDEGERLVRMPGAARVRDLSTDALVCDGDASFRVELPAGHTALFALEDADTTAT